MQAQYLYPRLQSSAPMRDTGCAWGAWCAESAVSSATCNKDMRLSEKGRHVMKNVTFCDVCDIIDSRDWLNEE